MKTRLANIWEVLHDSYWFIPTLMVIGALLFGLLLLYIDQHIEIEAWHMGNISFVYRGGIESARDLLNAIAGSIIAIAGVSFSITIVTLSLASTQYGPRLLRHYMRNTGNQVVLGTFVSTFVYCLLIYCQIPNAGIWDTPPRLAVSFAVILAFASIGIFIYFIHHMSEFIRADTIITAAFRELLARIENLYPEEMGLDVQHIPDSAQSDLPGDFESRSKPLLAHKSAYLQAITGEKLVQIAAANDLLIRIDCRPGEFLVQNRPVARVYPAGRVDQSLEDQLKGIFILGHQRTPEQDVGFAINELVEIALRALSPSLNDPFTAMSCIDRLTAGICRLSERRFPSPVRLDANHNARVVARTFSFDEFVEAAYGPIRRNARNNEPVKRHLSQSIQVVIDHAPSPSRHPPLMAQLTLIDQPDQSP